MGIFGYLDAGTGSMIASGIAAFGAAVAVLFITFKNRIMGWISPKRRQAAAEAEAAANPEAASVTDVDTNLTSDQG